MFSPGHRLMVQCYKKILTVLPDIGPQRVKIIILLQQILRYNRCIRYILCQIFHRSSAVAIVKKNSSHGNNHIRLYASLANNFNAMAVNNVSAIAMLFTFYYCYCCGRNTLSTITMVYNINYSKQIHTSKCPPTTEKKALRFLISANY